MMNSFQEHEIGQIGSAGEEQRKHSFYQSDISIQEMNEIVLKQVEFLNYKSIIRKALLLLQGKRILGVFQKCPTCKQHLRTKSARDFVLLNSECSLVRKRIVESQDSHRSLLNRAQEKRAHDLKRKNLNCDRLLPQTYFNGVQSESKIKLPDSERQVTTFIENSHEHHKEMQKASHQVTRSRTFSKLASFKVKKHSSKIRRKESYHEKKSDPVLLTNEEENEMCEESEKRSDIEDQFCSSTKAVNIVCFQRVTRSRLKFKCKVCKVNFQDAESLHRHLHTHSKKHSTKHDSPKSLINPEKKENAITKDKQKKEGNFVCMCCGRRFSSKKQKIQHEQIHNYKESYSRNNSRNKVSVKSNQCEFCGKIFESEACLKRHKRRHSKKNQVCGYCSKAFAEKSELVTHERTHTRKKPYSCELCCMTFAAHSSLTRHVHHHSGVKAFLCEQCGKAFKTKAELKRHGMTHTSERPYKCDLCEKRFSSKTNMVSHRLTHTGEKPFACTVCAKTFTRHFLLTIHMRTHTGEKPYKCSVCSRTFAQNSNYRKHLKVHSADKSMKRTRLYSCSLCNKSFFTELKLGVHLEKHSIDEEWKSERKKELDARRIECEICHRKFTNQRSMYRHQRVHTGNWPLRCDLCGKGCNFKKELDVHMRSHTGEKPFLCSVCPKSFAKKLLLTMHMRTHTGERPYKCSHCGRGFTQSSNLKKHIRNRHAHNSNGFREGYSVKFCYASASSTLISKSIQSTPASKLIGHGFTSTVSKPNQFVHTIKGNNHIRPINVDSSSSRPTVEQKSTNSNSIQQSPEKVVLHPESPHPIVQTDFCQPVPSFSQPNTSTISQVLNNNAPPHHPHQPAPPIYQDHGVHSHSQPQNLSEEHMIPNSQRQPGTMLHGSEQSFDFNHPQSHMYPSLYVTNHHQLSSTSTGIVMPHKEDTQAPASIHSLTEAAPALYPNRQMLATKKQPLLIPQVPNPVVNDNTLNYLYSLPASSYNANESSKMMEYNNNSSSNDHVEKNQDTQNDYFSSFSNSQQGKRYESSQNTAQGLGENDNSVTTASKDETSDDPSIRKSWLPRRSNKTERIIECGVCKRRFNDIRSLHRHERLHTGIWPFTCERCGKGCSYKAELERHERGHTGEKPYTCGVCDKKYALLRSLKRHMVSHESASNFQN